ncbi:unnamed protein product [Microthlaspi erraticum]|uniref:FAF domain-containing protein n=1 Tax=Microthlaspi erraticum TaxID=1685480 RepID=A0A6D2K518_9BRAS|nr:unnamed protein product [Microthlaspi erraticum]
MLHFYFWPVRKDGRLELTQVMIDRTDIFHASREDERLRLHLVDAYCDSKENVDLEDEPKGLDWPHLESVFEISEDNADETSDKVVNLSMINDDSGAINWRYKTSHDVSLNSDDYVVHFDDEHDVTCEGMEVRELL